MSENEWGPVEDPPKDRAGTMTLTLIDEYETTWLHGDGGVVIYSNETGDEVVAFGDLNLLLEWSAFSRSRFGQRDADRFLDHLRSLTYEPDEVDNVSWCADCASPVHADDLCDTNDGHEMVCDSCIDNYWQCNHCEERYTSTTTVNETEVCEGCLSNRYSFCENCDEYYYSYDGDGCGTDHEGCDCEAPGQLFTVRNDGLDPLANDTRVTITLPAGEISDEGIGQIAHLIRKHFESEYYAALEAARADGTVPPGVGGQIYNDILTQGRVLSYDLAPLGNQWQAKEGNYTKRLSRHAYKNHGFKIPPSVLSQIGNVASDHSRRVDFAIEVTRNLNLSAEDFGHEDSCWWQSYYHGRCALKSNGGFGMRTFTETPGYNGHVYDSVSGRAWVMPLRQTGGTDVHASASPDAVTGCTCNSCKPKTSVRAFAPTFDTVTPAAFVVFNGYGDLSGYVAARILAHMAGMTYRKITFTCNPMYVNGESGYLVAPEEIAEKYTDNGFHLVVDQHANLYDTESIKSKELSHA